MDASCCCRYWCDRAVRLKVFNTRQRTHYYPDHHRRHTPLSTAKTISNALISSRLDYCNSLLNNIAKQDLSKRQRVQNCLARVVLRAPRFSPSLPLLKQLHWLPVTESNSNCPLLHIALLQYINHLIWLVSCTFLTSPDNSDHLPRQQLSIPSSVLASHTLQRYCNVISHYCNVFFWYKERIFFFFYK